MDEGTIGSIEHTHANLHHQIYKPAAVAAKATTQPQPHHKPCNCRKSKCLKLYCECFANNRFCGPACACVCCNNSAQFDSVRLQAKQ